METTVLPLRAFDSPVDDRTALAVRRLAEGLIRSPEYQAYLRASQAISRDAEVARLIRQIRNCRVSFGCTDTAALQTELQALPVMAAYNRAVQALRALCAEVDRAIAAAAGVEFSANVRPGGHT